MANKTAVLFQRIKIGSKRRTAASSLKLLFRVLIAVSLHRHPQAKSAEQNVGFSKIKLRMPVFALGGEIATGDQLREAMQALADDVHGGVIEDCGHYLMEEHPEETARRVLNFLAYAEAKGK